MLTLEDACEEYTVACATYAATRDAEQQCEDERPVVKHEAIKRLMAQPNELTGKPHSASSAESQVELDAEYAGYLATRRQLVLARLRAECAREVARVRATALAMESVR
jgi:hypothetical protein